MFLPIFRFSILINLMKALIEHGSLIEHVWIIKCTFGLSIAHVRSITSVTGVCLLPFRVLPCSRWSKGGYLPWWGVPTLDGGTYPRWGGGYLPQLTRGGGYYLGQGRGTYLGQGRGTYLGWDEGYLPWTEGGVPTLDGAGDTYLGQVMLREVNLLWFPTGGLSCLFFNQKYMGHINSQLICEQNNTNFMHSRLHFSTN